jgi:hypothetical protein
VAPFGLGAGVGASVIPFDGEFEAGAGAEETGLPALVLAVAATLLLASALIAASGLRPFRLTL